MVKSGITLHGERVAVAREKTVEKIGSLYVPGTAQRDNQYAAVVFIGNGPEVQKMGLKIGDRLYTPKYRPTDIRQPVGKETYWLAVMHFSEVYMSYPDNGNELETGPPPEEQK